MYYVYIIGFSINMQVLLYSSHQYDKHHRYNESKDSSQLRRQPATIN